MKVAFGLLLVFLEFVLFWVLERTDMSCMLVRCVFRFVLLSRSS